MFGFELSNILIINPNVQTYVLWYDDDVCEFVIIIIVTIVYRV